jgi:hypothetical protein
MRHDQISKKNSYARVDVAAVWPASARVAPLPLPEADENQAAVFSPTPAAPDVPAAVGGLIVASYFALIGAFTLATIGSAQSIFAIAIVLVFALAFFTVPRLFFGVEPAAGKRPSFQVFLHQGMDTLTGHCGGRDALIQMMIVPVLLTFGALAMGVAAAVYL